MGGLDPLIGKALSHYRIGEKIDAGGMGEVYRAHDSRLSRDVAIKVLPPRYPSLQAIPGGVDGVVIIMRPEITERIVHDCGEAGVRRVWMHQSVGKGSSVSNEAVEFCRQRDISVIAGGCPMMYGPGADFGHTCIRWILRLTGGLPK